MYELPEYLEPYREDGMKLMLTYCRSLTTVRELVYCIDTHQSDYPELAALINRSRKKRGGNSYPSRLVRKLILLLGATIVSDGFDGHDWIKYEDA